MDRPLIFLAVLSALVAESRSAIASPQEVWSGRVWSAMEGEEGDDREVLQAVARAEIAVFAEPGVSGSEAPPALALSDEAGFFELVLAGRTPQIARIHADGFAPAWVVPVIGSEVSGVAQDVVLQRPAWLAMYAQAVEGVMLRRPDYMSVTATVTPNERLGPFHVGGNWSEYEMEQWEEGPEGVSGRLEDPLATLFGLPPSMPISIVVRFHEQVIAVHEVVLDAGRTRLNVQVAPPAVLRGTMRDQDGEPIRGWPVGVTAANILEINRPNCYPFLFVQTDQMGRFELPTYPGTWWVGPCCAPCILYDLVPEDGFPTKQEWVTSFGQWVTVESGETEREIDLQADRGLMIEGRVERPDGAPPVDAKVIVHNDRGLYDPPFLHSVGIRRIEEGSSFILGPLPSGEHRVRAKMPGYYAEPISVPAGSEDVTIPLRPTVCLRGTVVTDATGIPCAASVWVFGGGWYDNRGFQSNSQGEFVLDGLWPGTHDLWVQSPTAGAAQVVRGLEVRAESNEDLSVRLVPAAKLRLSNRTMGYLSWVVEWEDRTLRTGDLPAKEVTDWILLPPGKAKLHRAEHPYFSRPRSHTWGFSFVGGEEQTVEWWGR